MGDAGIVSRAGTDMKEYTVKLVVVVFCFSFPLPLLLFSLVGYAWTATGNTTQTEPLSNWHTDKEA